MGADPMTSKRHGPAGPRTQYPLATGLALAALTTGAALGLGGCKEEDDLCVSTADFFRDEVWTPTLKAKCVSCHTNSGAAKHSKFILLPEQVPGYLDSNMKTMQDLARYEIDGKPLILAKPTQDGVTHGGAMQLETGSEQYDAIAELLRRFDNPVECEDQINVGGYFDNVEQLDEVETLRKATLALVGRLPTEAEIEQVRDLGIDSLDPVLDQIFAEEAFYDRLTEIYNDVFLTDRYYNNTDAVALINPDKYPSYWFEGIDDDGLRDEAARATNKGLAREAINLVNHVVRSDRPYTEILTADYLMLTPYTAKAYGVNVKFDNEADPYAMVEGKLPGVPHAGVLTSAVWLSRFPTTATNRNRHRARMIYKLFLATDVLRLGERPIDPTSIKTVNPTLNNSNCSVCHALVDPIAGTFQNYQAINADYFPLENTEQMTWFPDMRLPGYGDVPMPDDQVNTSEQWLAKQIVADDRFATSAVHIVWRGLLGQDPLSEPFDAAQPDYPQALAAFQVQDRVIQSIADKFRGNGYNLKHVFREIIKTDYFRAKNVKGEVSEERAMELAELGTAQFLAPEQLERKIEAVTGYPWSPGPDQTPYLLNMNEYRIFYGGIDSNSITERISEPNGIMANISLRMANEMSCISTARDFSADPSDRLLFPYVEPTYLPEDMNQFAVPAVNDAILANIQHLYEHVLGERYDLDDPEIQEVKNLYVNIWRTGRNAVVAGTESADLAGPCRATNDYWTGKDLPEEQRVTADPNYTIRAWMGVLTYMLSDYKFLHE
ncbi:MAG: DUF1588 domain-containing protein [Myxococcales bacterium]|nr:DUF1588 domain-containing protein [Myxococcales bacterium]